MALIPHGYRIYCNKKLDPIIALGNETLEFLIDGKSYTVTIEAGVYRTYHEQFESELPAMINNVLTNNGVPLLCRLGGVYDYQDNRTVLVFEHVDTTNHHDVDIVGGTAYDLLVESILSTTPHEDGLFYADYNKSGTIRVVYPDMSEISGSISARRTEKSEVYSAATVRRTATRDLSGSIHTESASRLDGAIVIRRSDTSSLPGSGKVVIPIDDSYDIGSFLTVRVP